MTLWYTESAGLDELFRAAIFRALYCLYICHVVGGLVTIVTFHHVLLYLVPESDTEASVEC